MDKNFKYEQMFEAVPASGNTVFLNTIMYLVT